MSNEKKKRIIYKAKLVKKFTCEPLEHGNKCKWDLLFVGYSNIGLSLKNATLSVPKGKTWDDIPEEIQDFFDEKSMFEIYLVKTNEPVQQYFKEKRTAKKDLTKYMKSKELEEQKERNIDFLKENAHLIPNLIRILIKKEIMSGETQWRIELDNEIEMSRFGLPIGYKGLFLENKDRNIENKQRQNDLVHEAMNQLRKENFDFSQIDWYILKAISDYDPSIEEEMKQRETYHGSGVFDKIKQEIEEEALGDKSDEILENDEENEEDEEVLEALKEMESEEKPKEETKTTKKNSKNSKKTKKKSKKSKKK